jgi:hypothetical protein
VTKTRYKAGDVVLVSSIAGDVIPKIHVRLLDRVVVKPTPSRRVGFKSSMSWPGYSGWHAEIVYQEEADNLRKNWSIPFQGPGDKTWVFEDRIVKKPRSPSPNVKNQNSGKSRTVRRRKSKKS